MIKISPTGYEELIEVEFTVEFPPYKMEPGDRRKVSRRIAEKLYSEYGVIKKPDTTKKKFHESIITVRAVKSMTSVLGKGWYPNSIHTDSRELVQKYLDDGSIVIDGEEAKENDRDDVEHAEEEHDYPGFSWYASHEEWNGQKIERAVTCVTLAYQCGDDEAYKIIDRWIKKGSIENRDGRIYWGE